MSSLLHDFPRESTPSMPERGRPTPRYVPGCPHIEPTLAQSAARATRLPIGPRRLFRVPASGSEVRRNSPALSVKRNPRPEADRGAVPGIRAAGGAMRSQLEEAAGFQCVSPWISPCQVSSTTPLRNMSGCGGWSRTVTATPAARFTATDATSRRRTPRVNATTSGHHRADHRIPPEERRDAARNGGRALHV